MTPSKPPPKNAAPADGDSLWRHLTRNITPFHPGRALLAPETSGRKIAIVHAPRAKDTEPRQTRSAPAPIGTAAAPQPFRNADLDRNTSRRFTRGEMKPDSRLDLHGYTLAEAQRATERFIARMAVSGARCVHVVTGKGERTRHGRNEGGHNEGQRTIKGEFAHWLAAPALRQLILAIAPAKPKDGGGGAFYVLLRNPRKLKG